MVGVKDLTDRFNRPMKYIFFEHAERNAIFTAARHGIRTEGATLYVQALPCVDCARLVARSSFDVHLPSPSERSFRVALGKYSYTNNSTS